MAGMNRLTAHPRLYVTKKQIQRLTRPAPPELAPCARAVQREGEVYAASVELDYGRNRHNEHLVRARVMQRQVVTLLVRWFQTGDETFRRAVMKRIGIIDGWKYWSWITWRQGNPDPLAIFDLSYGENCATLAIAWDWLHGTLSAAEKQLFIKIARERALASFLHQLKDPRKRPRWFACPDYNWNSVCTGGAGMLALAMDEELPEARRTLELTEESFVPFMKGLDKTDGGWPEGVGYWNYGMRYALMYLLSHENATGRRHPLLHRPATRKTLQFPLDFTPNGVPCGFGDSNHFSPLPIHFAAAQRLKLRPVLAELGERLETILSDKASAAKALLLEKWPHAPEFLLLHPHRSIPHAPPRQRIAKLYKGLDWGLLADQFPRPRVYMSVRGGTTEVPHSHLDLLSFNFVMGDQSMITNLTPKDYLDTTFSNRRWELFEMMAASKNTLLINGVGIIKPARVTTAPIGFPAARGFRLEATAAMGTMRDANAARFAGRVFLMLDDGTALILDRVELPHVGRVEARLHTYAQVTLKQAAARLRRGGQTLSIRYAADVPALLDTAQGPMNADEPIPTMLRWRTGEQHKSFTLATLLCPGPGPATLALDTGGHGIDLTIGQGGRTRRFRFTTRLRRD
jgi:hypothetical protein